MNRFQGVKIMTNYEKFFEEQMQNPEIKKELSIRTGITKIDISKIESGNANPSIQTLQQLAAGMGRMLKIQFV